MIYGNIFNEFPLSIFVHIYSYLKIKVNSAMLKNNDN